MRATPFATRFQASRNRGRPSLETALRASRDEAVLAIFTMSNSVAFFVPAERSCARVVACFSLYPSPCSSLGGQMSKPPLAFATAGLRPRTEGAGEAPGGVTAVVALVRSRHSRLRGVLVPRNRDARLSALHRGAVGPGPLSRSGIAAGSDAMGCSRQALSCLTAEPGFSYPRVTSRGRRHSPLRRQDRLRRRPS
jgi:hypothetical protein